MVGEANDGPAIVVDSSGAPFGTHSGLSPMELILVGLAGCTGMDVISILTKQRQPVTGFQVRVEGERADSHPKVYTKIHVEYVVYGEGVEEKAVARAVKLSEETYCSVMGMLHATVDITNSYRIVEDRPMPNMPGEMVG
jgi:putative redox protein